MYTTKQLSKKLGVNPPTLRLWVRELNLPTHKQGNKLVFDPEVLDLLRTVKSMRGENCGFNTITKKIGSEITEKLPRNQEAELRNYNVILQEMKSEFSQTLKNELQTNTDLAEKYARATYEIGSLTEKVNQLESELKLLPDKSDWKVQEYKLSELEKATSKQEHELSELEKVKIDQEKEIRTYQAELEKIERFKNAGLWHKLKYALGLSQLD